MFDFINYSSLVFLIGSKEMKKQIYKLGKHFIVVKGNRAVYTANANLAKSIFRGAFIAAVITALFSHRVKGCKTEQLINKDLATPLQPA